MTPTAREVRNIEFSPDLPYMKKIAMDALYYMGSTKIFLKFSRPFWSEQNDIRTIKFNTTDHNGGGGLSDDLLRIVSILLLSNAYIATLFLDILSQQR